MISMTFATLTYAALLGGAINWAVSEHKARLAWAHSRFPGHALTPTGVMAIRCKQFHLPDL